MGKLDKKRIPYAPKLGIFLSGKRFSRSYRLSPMEEI